MSSHTRRPSMSMDEVERDVVRLPGCTRPTRRCYSAVSPAYPFGSFYPNYQTQKNALTGLSRPVPGSACRDTTLDSLFTDDVQAKVDALLPATGILYVGSGGPGKLNGTTWWDQSDVSTWWLLEHNGKLVGVSVLRTFRIVGQFKAYINTTLEGNLKSERVIFHRQEVDLHDFAEVKLRMDLVAIRERYIRDLHATQNSVRAAENIDLDYNLQYGVTCDIAFLDLDSLPAAVKTKLAARPHLKIATNPPVVGAFDIMIGYNYGGPWKAKDLADEFAATVINTPLPGNLYFSEIRSVSLGVVKSVGTGIVTDISTMEEMSSGSPKLMLEGGEFRVFGISVGSYYDKPNPNPPDWSLIDDHSNAIKLDIQLPEPGRTTAATSKNRNIILSFHHPCVAEMLTKL